MTSSWATRIAVAATALTTAVLCSPATAAAHHREFTPLPLTYSLGQQLSLPCAGQMTGDVYTPHDRPGIAVVTISWQTFFTSPCSIIAYVNMSNTDTQTGGSWMMHLTHVHGAPQSEWTRQISIPIGSGNAGLTVTTDSPLNSTLLDPAGYTTRFVVA